MITIASGDKNKQIYIFCADIFYINLRENKLLSIDINYFQSLCRLLNEIQIYHKKFAKLTVHI